MFSASLWCSLALLVSSTFAASKNTKRGLAFAAGSTPGDIINANQTKSLISWQYNWADLPPAYLATSNIPFIPMQWGSSGVDQFGSDIAAQAATTILGFNEPDFNQESNISPANAASLWKQFIEPLKAQGVRLGGPAVSSGSTGLPWLAEFFGACNNCTIDFLPLHWYGVGTEGFYDYIWQVHGQYPNIPIWITEFADTSTNVTEVLSFMNASTSYLDSLDWIERYAWFGYFRPAAGAAYNLLDADGGLTTIGQFYVGASTVHTQVVTSAAPTNTYKTVNGADGPSQSLVTTFAPAINNAIQAWSISGTLALCFAATWVGGILGALLTIW